MQRLNTMILDMVPKGVGGELSASEGDIGRPFTFYLEDQGKPYSIPAGATVKLQGTGPGGKRFAIPGTFIGSAVTAKSTEDMTAEPGRCVCAIKVTSGPVSISSQKFSIKIEGR